MNDFDNNSESRATVLVTPSEWSQKLDALGDPDECPFCMHGVEHHDEGGLCIRCEGPRFGWHCGSDEHTRATTVTGDRTHALTAEGHDASEDGTGRGTPIVAFSHTAGIDLQASTEGATSVLAGHDRMPAVSATTVRRLTPRECERLMGWPDDHTRYRIGPDGTPVEQADSNRYRQCGNGMAAPVVAWIANRIVNIDAIEGRP